MMRIILWCFDAYSLTSNETECLCVHAQQHIQAQKNRTANFLPISISLEQSSIETTNFVQNL